MEAFIYCLANKSLPWAAYFAFMSGCLVVLHKQPGVQPIVVRETWRRIFDKIVLKVTGPENTMACQDDQLFDSLKAGIDRKVHRFQAIWDGNLIMEDWGFLLIDTKTYSTRSIKSECCGQSIIYGHPKIALFLIAIVTGY